MTTTRAAMISLLVYLASAGVQQGWFWGSPLAPAPIAAPGLRVIVAYETDHEEFLTYTPGEREAINATAPGSVRAYCAARCAKGADGVTPEALFTDDDSSLELLPPYWRPAWDRRPRDPAGGLPWLIASNGRTGYEGPLPDTAAETLALLQRIGGE